MMHADTAIFGSRRTRTAGSTVKGSNERLALRLDMILTGISRAGQPMGDGRGPLLGSGGLREETFRELVLVDISGVLIEKGTLSRGQKAALTGLKARRTGLNEEELRACAKHAAISEARAPRAWWWWRSAAPRPNRWSRQSSAG